MHNAPPARAEAFGLAWEELHAAHPALVVGVVTSFGPHGPLAGAPAYDLVAQGRSGLLTSHASSRRPRPGARRRDPDGRPHGGTPARDRGAGRARAGAHGGRGAGSSRCRCSAPRSPSRSRTSSGSRARRSGAAAAATRGDLAARADEIAGGLAMNPYYRCYEAADGFLAVACLNLGAAAGVPRALRPRRSDDRGARPRAGRRRRARGEAARHRVDRAGDRGRAGGGLAGAARRSGRSRRAGARPRDACTPMRRCVRTAFCRTSSSPASGRSRCSARVFRLDGGEPAATRPAPALGADTEAVLAEVGA